MLCHVSFKALYYIRFICRVLLENIWKITNYEPLALKQNVNFEWVMIRNVTFIHITLQLTNHRVEFGEIL